MMAMFGKTKNRNLPGNQTAREKVQFYIGGTEAAGTMEDSEEKK